MYISATFFLVMVIVFQTFGPRHAQAADIFAGQTVYEAHCASCHGTDGVPLVPGTPDFALGRGLDKPDVFLVETIRTGVNLMPGYDRIIDDQDILNAIAYIRTLRR